jgi:hypothetical protein
MSRPADVFPLSANNTMHAMEQAGRLLAYNAQVASTCAGSPARSAAAFDVVVPPPVPPPSTVLDLVFRRADLTAERLGN